MFTLLKSVLVVEIEMKFKEILTEATTDTQGSCKYLKYLKYLRRLYPKGTQRELGNTIWISGMI